jgi:hypothetical protein
VPDPPPAPQAQAGRKAAKKSPENGQKARALAVCRGFFRVFVVWILHNNLISATTNRRNFALS